MKQSLKQSLNLPTVLLTATLALTPTLTPAQARADYFRVWNGFAKPGLTADQLLLELPAFMKATVDLYQSKNALNNYIVAIPPKNSPAYIPHELALVGLTSEQAYREIRQTPEGTAYSEKHWEIFDKPTSSSAKTFVDYTAQPPMNLENDVAYDMIGKPIDWAKGYSLVFLGTRKAGQPSPEFLSNLKAHLELAKKNMQPLGLRGYIVRANNNFEVAYLNWPSKAAHDAAFKTAAGLEVFADGGRIMDVLMYQAAEPMKAGLPIEEGRAYSTVQRNDDGSDRAPQKVLIVVTSHQQLGNTGKLTGYYLPEVTHPFFELMNAGFQVDIASPQGGEPPMDERSRNLEDPRNLRFIKNEMANNQLSNTLSLEAITPSEAKQYRAILFAGGHGTMWDFPASKQINLLASTIYQSGGVVAAVCHGPAALIGITLPNGSPLIEGKKVTGFSDAEEAAAGLTDVMPFSLELGLKALGAQYSAAPLWQEWVVTDQHLVTGQNPASAKKVGEEVVRLLRSESN